MPRVAVCHLKIDDSITFGGRWYWVECAEPRYMRPGFTFLSFNRMPTRYPPEFVSLITYEGAAFEVPNFQVPNNFLVETRLGIGHSA